MAEETPATPARREAPSFGWVVLSWQRWWRDAVVGTVDQAAVIEKRREDGALSSRYMFMIAMSGGIAILGLLLSSPAVVIGAMLLSPLMGPIMGLGFAMAIGDFSWMRQSAKSLAYGSLMAIALCALVVFMSPLQTVTTEIAARTRPNLFDLLVALFSSLAGAYAMIRGREGTIVGVAIATALMPPLAVVGFGIATLNWTVFSGALLLFFTNLMTIALTAAVMARIYGFRTTLSSRQTQFQNIIIVAAFVALALPLGYSLRTIAWEANSSRQVQAQLMNEFDGRARISQLDINFDADPIEVSATVLTPRLIDDAEARGARSIGRVLNQPVNLVLTQYQVGTSKSAAEQAQLAAASQQEEVANERADELAKRLALLAGVTEDEVLIDRQRRHALVKAKVLDGATLAAYRALELRISRTEPDWDIELLPPALPLPSIMFEDGEPTADGLAKMDVVAWAANRLDARIRLAGPADEVEKARAIIAAQGVGIETETRSGRLTVGWLKPGE